jgi:hypothetical protein
MFGDRREEIVVRHVEGFAQRLVEIVRDGAAIVGRLAGSQRYANEGHGLLQSNVRSNDAVSAETAAPCQHQIGRNLAATAVSR